MGLKLHSEITLYENNLDTKKFEKLLDNKSQCYKCYWLEAIMRLFPENEEITFEQIIDEMIWEAWETVSYYHLHLGPTINGNAENFLEHAINTLNAKAKGEIDENPSHDQIISLCKKYNEYLLEDKKHLTDYVPYRLIRPFIDKEAKTYLDKKQYSRLISYLNLFTASNNEFFYNIIDGDGLTKKIVLNKSWRQAMLDNYSIIMGWIQYNKAQFIQDRNPGVPGIICKIGPESSDVRKLEKARDLWKTTVEITGKPVIDVYSGELLDLNKFDLDHFVPRSYTANDELWNLTPIDKNLNCSKNNRLPKWNEFFVPFAKNQYFLYDLIFPASQNLKSVILIDKFEKCRRNNVNAIWASDNLYIPGNTQDQFVNMLEHNLRPVFEAAMLQGYDTWEHVFGSV